MSIRDVSPFAWLAFAFAFVFLAATPAAAQPAPGPETNCSDGKDDDGDLVYDCGDNDCKDDPACVADGEPENTSERCGDWIDNDGDGYTDCDDNDCGGNEACYGSFDVEMAGGTVSAGASDGSGGTTPESGDGSDLIGKGADKDGERDNLTCSDGIDNDSDGAIDCLDLGCKLDTSVTVCQPSSDFRFSVVARVKALGYEYQPTNTDPGALTTEFDSLQMRVLGQMPFIQNSFFLLSARAEKTPRMVFALFQVPIGNRGHYFNINSGGGGLALEVIRSVHKRLLADPGFYVYNAFEQGNGAAIEFGGPFDKKNKFLFRGFAAGGSGRFAGNIGGTFFPDDNRNYTWSLGTQLWMNLVGYYNRWDSPFLFTKAPLSVALAVGGKFDQRAQERYPAWNSQFILRWWRFHLQGEYYGKRELVFRNWQNAYNIQVGFLPWQKRMLLAADFGQYLATDFERPPENPGTDLRRQLGELQYRAAWHIYLWRDVFFATTVWRERRVEPRPGETGIQVIRDARLLFTYRW